MVCTMKKEIIGDHVLYCGDSYEVISSLKYDCIITDPPYKLVATGGGLGAKRQYLSDIDNHIDSGFDLKIFDNCTNWLSFCSKEQLLELINKAESSSLRWALLTWNKPNPTPLTNGNYLPDTEYIIHAFKKLPDNSYHDKKKYKVHPIEKNQFEHPSVKPLAICDWVVKSASTEGDVVLDPFMGTGSVGLSCHNLKRRFIGIELEQKYFDIACCRLDKLVHKPNLNNFFD